MTIVSKLEIYQRLQCRYPGVHIGGSIGLLLHGIDLKRDLLKSDLDVTSPLPIELNDICLQLNAEERSDVSDFDLCIKAFDYTGGYAKIDVRVTPELSFVIIHKEGFDYQVSKLEDILFWKKKYASKKVQKHIDDLIVIDGGERPAQIIDPKYALDELPF